MKTRTLVITILLACVALGVAFVVACAGLFFYMYRNMDETVSPRIDAMFAAIDHGTFGDTYLTDTTPEFRTVTSKEQYEQIGSAVKERLGSLQSKTLVQFNTRQFNSTSSMSVVYSATFEKGTGTIRAELKSMGGPWLFHGFFVDSPEFLKSIAAKKCPECGKASSVDAKFCSHCGKSMPKEQPVESPTTKEKSQAK